LICGDAIEYTAFGVAALVGGRFADRELGSWILGGFATPAT
jgi:hypothetical protein